jgi:hypothetical protein
MEPSQDSARGSVIEVGIAAFGALYGKVDILYLVVATAVISLLLF